MDGDSLKSLLKPCWLFNILFLWLFISTDGLSQEVCDFWEWVKFDLFDHGWEWVKCDLFVHGWEWVKCD